MPESVRTATTSLWKPTVESSDDAGSFRCVRPTGKILVSDVAQGMEQVWNEFWHCHLMRYVPGLYLPPFPSIPGMRRAGPKGPAYLSDTFGLAQP